MRNHPPAQSLLLQAGSTNIFSLGILEAPVEKPQAEASVSGLSGLSLLLPSFTLQLSFPEDIVSIVWKHNKDLVAEWVKDMVDLTFYGVLENRATMELTTGVLNITNMTRDNEGVYSVEINLQLQGTVSRCRGPVSYRWKVGEQDWAEGEKDMEIFNSEEEEERPKTFTCRIKTPVSESGMLVTTELFMKCIDAVFM
uniref:Ig-like domain-containing protein n=1 Tax=Salarias fasciatus TaxID=181472 RepID=A0A672HF41_SALFA